MKTDVDVVSVVSAVYSGASGVIGLVLVERGPLGSGTMNGTGQGVLDWSTDDMGQTYPVGGTPGS